MLLLLTGEQDRHGALDVLEQAKHFDRQILRTRRRFRKLERNVRSGILL